MMIRKRNIKKWKVVITILLGCIVGLMNVEMSEVKAETYGDYEWGRFIYYGTTGVQITRYSGEETEIKIPSEIYGQPVIGIGEYAFSDCSSLVEIIIPDSVTSIGDYAFSRCSGLTNIAIPSSVTNIGSGAFSRCSGLTNIAIPSSVTSIGEEAVTGCSGLTKIQVASDNKKYDSRNNCNAIIDKETNTLIAGCKNTIIPEGVMSIGEWAFSGCSNLVEIIIPDSLVRISKNAFLGCNSLKSITLPKNVEYLGTGKIGDSYYSAFYGCANLEEINVDPENKLFSSYDGILYNKDMTSILCVPKALTSCVIPDSVKSIEEGAFGDCDNLEKIELSDNVVNIGRNAFEHCDNLKMVKMADSVTDIGIEAFGWCTSLVQIRLSNNLTAIPTYAFYGCSSLVEITIPGSMTSISNSTFAGCDNLQEIYLSKDHPDYTNYKGILYNTTLQLL